MKFELKKITMTAAIGVFAFGLASCATTHKPAPVENAYTMGQSGGNQSDSSAVQTAGVGQEDQFQGQNVDTSWMDGTTRRVAQQMGIRNNTIYFSFDKSTVSSQYNNIVQANANYLRAHPNAKVRLQGNTDPKGSREYNIGLGQRRSSGVEQRLLALGVNSRQITTVSYGQEKPAEPGDSAQAYALDRRVNIVYTAAG